jgi:hypothetical protein
MTEEQLQEQARQEVQNEQERLHIIVNKKIFYSEEELSEMSQMDRANAIIQMKQDETMKWQRLCSQLVYYVTIASLILGGIIGFIILINSK